MALKSVANTIDGRRKMSQEEMVRILTAVKRIEDAINYRNTEVL
jgi:hypothetical protein